MLKSHNINCRFTIVFGLFVDSCIGFANSICKIVIYLLLPGVVTVEFVVAVAVSIVFGSQSSLLCSRT